MHVTIKRYPAMSIIIHSSHVVLLCFFCSDSGLILMDIENGTYKYIYNNMQMLLFTCSMLYIPLNRVLTTLNGNHVIMKIRSKETHFNFNKYINMVWCSHIYDCLHTKLFLSISY